MLLSAKIISPSLICDETAGPEAFVTTRPFLPSSIFLSLAVASFNTNPILLALSLIIFLFEACILSSGISPILTLSVLIFPFLQISTGTTLLGLVSLTYFGRSEDVSITLLLNLRITSPASIPALPAGAPLLTAATSAPLLSFKPNASVSSSVTS